MLCLLSSPAWLQGEQARQAQRLVRQLQSLVYIHRVLSGVVRGAESGEQSLEACTRAFRTADILLNQVASPRLHFQRPAVAIRLHSRQRPHRPQLTDVYTNTCMPAHLPASACGAACRL